MRDDKRIAYRIIQETSSGPRKDKVKCNYSPVLELEPVELKMIQFWSSALWCASLSSLHRPNETSLDRGVSAFPHLRDRDLQGVECGENSPITLIRIFPWSKDFAKLLSLRGPSLPRKQAPPHEPFVIGLQFLSPFTFKQPRRPRFHATTSV
jgi:hypothetical protein